MTKTGKPEKILIVGGGTAGWMAACLLNSRWPDIEVCVLESRDIGIVGVGEGSTPHLKVFFDAVGIEESEWMPQCNATYKNGISFHGWSLTPGFESYFHPFPAQTDDLLTVPLFLRNVQARLRGESVPAHPDRYFLESYLTQQNLGPIADECFPFGAAYGYHFDSKRLGEFLAEKAVARGVKRIIGTVAEVLLGTDGAIASVRLEGNDFLGADFFVDCSGFRSLLMQGALKTRFLGFEDNLFNDAAVVLPCEISTTIPPETRSTALSNGWAWKIPLTNRYGNGYVYSSSHIDADRAEIELRQHLGLLDSDTPARHLNMKVGRVASHWTKNCLAVGLSQGFIEPLEATAIALSFETVRRFMLHFERGGFTNQGADDFNREINTKFEGIRDYIVCHYKVNQRRDTDYWRDNAANTKLSEHLSRILYLWQHSENFAQEMQANHLGGSYQPKSWACLLAGYGVFPPLRSSAAKPTADASQEQDQLADFIRRCSLNFRPHNELLSPAASGRPVV